MEHQFQIEEKEKNNQTKKQYTQNDMYHIAELYGGYYLTINSRSNVLSPHRIQINKKNWIELTLEYNKRQELLPNNEGNCRTEKALTDKWLAMRTQYQAKKEILKSTGSGGGPISGYLKKMHEYLHDDPQFHPKATYSSSKRAYVVRDDQEKQDCVDLSDNPNDEQKNKKKKTAKEETEEARLKSRDETLDRMKQITETMTGKLEEIMTKPLVIQHVESDEKKEFYKKFLELMEKGLN